MFLKITRSGTRQYLQLVEAFRDEAGKARHRTLVVSAPQTPFFPDSLGRDQMLGLEIPGQEGLEVFDSGRGR